MAISVEGAYKRFGDFQALDDVSIEVPDGSLMALLGPSGSGKSTLLRAIAGLETLDAGRVMIRGEDVSKRPPQKREVGFVFQHYAAFKHMSVFDNVAFGLKIRKQKKPKIQARVHELLELVQLDGLADRLPSQLSGGQRQRMALARALAVEPQVLLLDEPFGALDAKVRKDLRAWLRRLHDETGVTTIFVTHDQEEAMDVAEQLVVMNQGRVEQAGSASDLYDQPANEFVMSFVGEVNRLGEHFVRPHDMQVVLDPDEGTVEAMIRRVVPLGFEVRVEVVLGDGTEVWAQLTRSELQQLELREGQIVHLRPGQAKSFSGAPSADGNGASTPRDRQGGGGAEVSAAA
jgi:sulfate/thiosulfate transport system ATP-binding protein